MTNIVIETFTGKRYQTETDTTSFQQLALNLNNPKYQDSFFLLGTVIIHRNEISTISIVNEGEKKSPVSDNEKLAHLHKNEVILSKADVDEMLKIVGLIGDLKRSY